MDTSNKFFVKFEGASHHGRDIITFASHVPKVISPEDALNLAAWLVREAARSENPWDDFWPYVRKIIGIPSFKQTCERPTIEIADKLPSDVQMGTAGYSASDIEAYPTTSDVPDGGAQSGAPAEEKSEAVEQIQEPAPETIQ